MSEKELLYGIIAIVLQFLSGSIMYSYIFARMLRIDLSKVRDGNPGSSNLWRAAGWKFGVVALALDYLKGVFPLGIFIANGLVTDNYLISIAALAGIAGHAFSPMLKFKGGKAIATTFGAWSVLTKWEAPMLMGTIFTIFSIVKPKTNQYEDAVRYILGLMALLVYVIVKSIYIKDGYLLLLYAGNFTIALYKHKEDLKRAYVRTPAVSSNSDNVDNNEHDN
ncbi:MAG: glycerol-3-phosphate acyltransferase [Fervidobacterium sp.]